jgi:RNA polymerase sigma factor (TIGR02999 family)
VDQSDEVTRLLDDLQKRQQKAAPKLFELLYNDLRHMALRHIQSEGADHTLQATALVHEAYLRLLGAREDWRNRAHFFAIASTAMRRILVDHARAKHAAKRPDAKRKVNLDDLPLICAEPRDEILALDSALERLSQIDARQGRIVELRYFGGLTSEEAAEVLGVSTITVQRDWAVAKAWLHGELAGRAAAPSHPNSGRKSKTAFKNP